jgi:hypothetical protein
MTIQTDIITETTNDDAVALEDHVIASFLRDAVDRGIDYGRFPQYRR